MIPVFTTLLVFLFDLVRHTFALIYSFQDFHLEKVVVKVTIVTVVVIFVVFIIVIIIIIEIVFLVIIRNPSFSLAIF